MCPFLCHYTDRFPALHTYLDFHVVVEEDVPQFQVSVDDLVAVQIMDPFQQLGHVVASLRLRDRLPALVQLQQGLEKGQQFW